MPKAKTTTQFIHFQVYRFPKYLQDELRIHCIRHGLNRQDFIIKTLAKAVKFDLEKANGCARRERAAAAAERVAEDTHT